MRSDSPYRGPIRRPSQLVKAEPALVEGKERCPVCRNVVTRNGDTGKRAGKLKGHSDLFGHHCFGPAAEFEVSE